VTRSRTDIEPGEKNVTDTEMALEEPVLLATPTAEAPELSKWVGVGGWLLFFCISLTVFNPASTLYNLTAGFIQNASYLAEDMGLFAFFLTDTLVSLSIGAFSLFAGISLWRVRPKAVQTARAFLLAGMIYTLVAPFAPLLLDLTAAARQQVIDSAVVAAGRGVLYYIIWFNYLMRSKRVAVTYPDWTDTWAFRASTDRPARWYHVVLAIGAVMLIIAVASFVSSMQ